MECEFGKRTKAFKDNIKFLIDEEDYEKIVKDESFCKTSNGGYVYNAKKKKLLHRLIMNVEDRWTLVDHINGNPLDNRKCNLRICNQQQNSFNKSKYKNNKTGFKGVCFDKSRNKFKAQIMLNGKSIHLGRFEKSEDAYKAYCEACVKYHQEFHHT